MLFADFDSHFFVVLKFLKKEITISELGELRVLLASIHDWVGSVEGLNCNSILLNNFLLLSLFILVIVILWQRSDVRGGGPH